MMNKNNQIKINNKKQVVVKNKTKNYIYLIDKIIIFKCLTIAIIIFLFKIISKIKMKKINKLIKRKLLIKIYSSYLNLKLKIITI